MGWVKLDDGFAMHPKVIGLSLEARWVYIEALCWAARYRTDGILPEAVAAKGPVRAELMASGLWENGPASGTVSIHDYLAYNLSREEYNEKAVAGALGGAIASAQAGAKQPLKQNASTSPSRPVPTRSRPVPSFDEFWGVYPRKVGKPKAVSTYRRALKRASAEDIILGAKRYAEDPNRDDEYTAHPTTWLNRDGWNDPPLPSHGRKSEHLLDRMAYEEVNRAPQRNGSSPQPATPRELPRVASQ
jgi:hypothetical protein